MIVMQCFVQFTSPLGLREVAAQISKHLFGGLPFVDTDEFDEVPGVRLERLVLGLWVTICGEGPQFGLRFKTSLPVFAPKPFPEINFLDVDQYIQQRLELIENIEIIRPL
jgi:hypothetical protein